MRSKQLQQYLDSTIAEIYGLRHPPTKRVIGVEIEVEGDFNNLNPGGMKDWVVEHDHSLRNGIEFILRPPKTLVNFKASLKQFESAIKDCNIVPSIRTSIHVHVNVSHFTFQQVVNFLFLYWCVEDILVGMNGEEREGNLFCLRASDAEGIFWNLLDSYKKGRPLSTNVNNNLRYAALNLASLSKFGTLEFRFIRGAVDIDEIFQWTSNLHDFVYSSTRFKSPVEIINRLSDPTALLEDMSFSKPFVTEMKRWSKNLYPDMMRRNYSTLLIVAKDIEKMSKPLRTSFIHSTEDAVPRPAWMRYAHPPQIEIDEEPEVDLDEIDFDEDIEDNIDD